MTNNLSLTFTLTLLLLALLTAHAHAEWERILDERTYSLASDGERLYASTEKRDVLLA